MMRNLNSIKFNCSIFVLVISIFLCSQLFAQTAANTSFTITLPQPSGSYSIGTTSFGLKDSSRDEIFTADPNDKREIFVQCWYPAQKPKAEAKPVPLWGKDTGKIVEIVGASLGLKKAQLDEIANSPSHSYLDAPFAKTSKPFPVLIFSHGYGVFAAQNTSQFEELASHGYIVFSIGHLYESSVNVFPDERVVKISRERVTKFGEGSEKVLPIAEKLRNATDPKEMDKLFRESFSQMKQAGVSLKIWTDDTLFVLDEITKWNADKQSIFAKKLDLNRIGFFGMSFGGAVAGQICVTDKRCRAGINLDGSQFGEMIDNPIKKPFMFMHSEDGRNINRLFYEKATKDAYYIEIKGSKHFNFTDYTLLPADFQKNVLKMTFDGNKMETIVNSYVLAFFEKYLRGKKSQILEKQPENFSEITFLAK